MTHLKNLSPNARSTFFPIAETIKDIITAGITIWVDDLPYHRGSNLSKGRKPKTAVLTDRKQRDTRNRRASTTMQDASKFLAADSLEVYISVDFVTPKYHATAHA